MKTIFSLALTVSILTIGFVDAYCCEIGQFIDCHGVQIECGCICDTQFFEEGPGMGECITTYYHACCPGSLIA